MVADHKTKGLAEGEEG